MKRIIQYAIFIVLYCNVFHANGQITIVDSSAPKAAEDIIYTQSNKSVDVSKTGPNSTWDFSKTIATSQDTFKFLAPGDISSAYATPFKGDLGLDLKNPNVNGSFVFFNTSSSDFRGVGIGITVPVINLPTPLPYKLPDIIYRFPMKYGNTDSCNYGGRINIFGTNASITGKRVDTVDGWGKIITPYKTYNCLRIKSVVTETDTIGSTIISNNSVQYKWISSDEHIPVFEADVIPNGMGGTSMGLHYRDSYKDIQDPDRPIVEFDALDTSVYVGDTVYFHDKSIGLSSWYWTILPANYSFVGGTTRNSQNPEVIFNSEGQYSVSLKSGVNTRLRIDYITVLHNSDIVVKDNDNNKLDLYPNPTSERIYLIPDKNMTGKSCRISILDETGRLIYDKSKVLEIDRVLLDFRDYSKGMYIINIQDEDQLYSSKVILK